MLLILIPDYFPTRAGEGKKKEERGEKGKGSWNLLAVLLDLLYAQWSGNFRGLSCKVERGREKEKKRGEGGEEKRGWRIFASMRSLDLNRAGEHAPMAVRIFSNDYE